MNEVRPNFDKQPDAEQELLYREMLERYDQMVGHLLNGYDTEAAKAVMEAMIQDFC